MDSAPTILVVEDHIDNRVIYCLALRYHGYTVMEATDGENALQMVKERTPDLILLDISLPRMDGYAVATALRANTETKGIPIIALSAHAFKEDRLQAAAAGFDGYLVKPIEPRVVVTEVDRYLEQHTRSNRDDSLS